jgi:hypothetical protein
MSDGWRAVRVLDAMRVGDSIDNRSKDPRKMWIEVSEWVTPETIGGSMKR